MLKAIFVTFFLLIILLVLVVVQGVIVGRPLKSLTPNLGRTGQSLDGGSSVTNGVTGTGVATLSVSPQSTVVDLGQEQSIDVKLRALGQNISAVSVRLIYVNNGKLVIAPLDADSRKKGIQVEVNSNLTDAGWVFPVNTIEVDDEKKRVVIDFAALNLLPTGYVVHEDEMKLATFNFRAQSVTSNLSFTFDPEETKVITKSGNEVNLNLDKGLFVIQ